MKYAEAGTIKLYHHTPMSRPHWCWALCTPILTLLPGPQQTIMGTTVMHGGSMMWEGVSLEGHKLQWPTRDEAQAYCTEHGIRIDCVEIA